MSEYFKLFPTIDYNGLSAKNITLRVKINEVFGSSGFLYYTIRDGERPDTIAHDYYGSSDLSWLVLLANNILDPYHEWPLQDRDINALIVKKYGSIANALANPHHYVQNAEKLYRKKTDWYVVIDEASYGVANKSDYELITDVADTIEISVNNYDTRADKANFSVVTDYDYEYELNGTKKFIRLLDKQHLNYVISNIKTLLND